MNHEPKFADGDRVRFTAHALAVNNFGDENGKRVPIPRKRATETFTVTNTPDSFHDVVLNNGERWWEGYLEPAEEGAPS